MVHERDTTRRFALHWGSGRIIEEARATCEHHTPALQLLEFDEGEAAGTLSIRFCYYSPDGHFQRSPLIVSEGDAAALREALTRAPRLRALLRAIVE